MGGWKKKKEEIQRPTQIFIDIGGGGVAHLGDTMMKEKKINVV